MFHSVVGKIGIAVVCAVGLSYLVVKMHSDDESLTIKVSNGTAEYVADTPVVSVVGTSRELQAQVKIVGTKQGFHLSELQARVPVESFKTGMKMRDEHARELIFTTPDKKTPDLEFYATDVQCPSRGVPCKVAGMLTVQGLTKPFVIVLKISDSGTQFKVSGTGIVKLSDYGITPPSEAMVHVSNAVTVNLAFVGASIPSSSKGE